MPQIEEIADVGLLLGNFVETKILIDGFYYIIGWCGKFSSRDGLSREIEFIKPTLIEGIR